MDWFAAWKNNEDNQKEDKSDKQKTKTSQSRKER